MPVFPHVRYLHCIFVAMVALLGGACASQNKQKLTQDLPEPPIYLNTALSIDKRVDDLVSRMTLSEKVSQMLNEAPAIERLGVSEYNWWSEGLHGVARAGLATVFPQAIGLSASWDEKTLFDVATAISDEARAKHHAFALRGKRFLYQGLTLWSPNINIFRDPRWGRGQETYGEDPYLTGRMGINFIRGLQGDNPKYLKTIATVKHFAVHSGPEPERHEFNAITNKKDLYETYLPQFEMGIKEAGAYSLMCAYNRYNGEAACASKYLMSDILRQDWGFDGFVVSDCGAILDLHAHHKITNTAAESAALAVKAGTDLNCGKVYPSLVQAVDQGLIEEGAIDIAVKRLFKGRMKLGMFDPEQDVEYAQIPYSVVDSKKHRALALRAAQKSIVLLKNDGNTLPLKKNVNTLAVIGPNSDQWLMLLGNYNGVPSDPVTPLRGIQEKVGAHTKVLFAQGSELGEGLPMLYPVPKRVLINAAGDQGVDAVFFNNAELKGEAVYTETHDNVDANWNDKAPRADMDDDNFGVRWTATLTPEVSGNYQIGIISTCNTNVWLNDTLIASTPYHFRNEFGDPRTRKSDWISLEAGKEYAIKVEAGETYADAQVQLVWAEPKPNLRQQAIHVAKQADAVVMFMGLTARMEGEEMDIHVDGFRGGDRTKLSLPKVQRDLIKAIHALGKPVVLVNLSGSALALNWEHKNIPAIIQAWYPGQAAGSAIADVLFGDYNPAGRLPVTFYKSVDQLPAFDDYNITIQTYRFFNGEPLYPFGYGLSYSQFRYSNMVISSQAQKQKNITLQVDVKNTGAVDGDEVVQVYLTNKATNIRTPIRQLVAFKRIHLLAGAETQLSFEIAADNFLYIDANGKKQFSPGKFEISVGGGQPHQKTLSTSPVLTREIVYK